MAIIVSSQTPKLALRFAFSWQGKSKKNSECALAHFFTHHSKAFADVSLSQQLFAYICHSELHLKYNSENSHFVDFFQY